MSTITSIDCVNCTVNKTVGQTISDGSYYYISFTANDGYAFNLSTDYIIVRDSVTFYYTPANNPDKFTVNNTVCAFSAGGTYKKSIVIEAHASPVGTPEKPFVELDLQFTNCSSQLQSGVVRVDDVRDIFIQTDDGFDFANGFTLNGELKTPETNPEMFKSKSIGGDPNTEIYIEQHTFTTEFFSLKAVGVEIIKVLPDVVLQLDLVDVTTNLPSSFKKGDVVNLVINAINGKEFNPTDEVVLSFKKYLGDLAYDVYSINSTPALFSNDNKTFSITFTQNNDTFFLLAKPTKVTTVIPDPEPEPEPDPPLNNDVPFNETFLVDKTTLDVLSKKWYFIDSIGVLIDKRGYIYDLFSIPFKLETGVSVDSKRIYLGKDDTLVDGRYLTDVNIKMNLGNITVPEKYNNVYDYDNVECFINLPFIKKIKLDVNEVVGQTIKVDYIFNVYERKCSVNIYSTFSNNVIYTDIFEFGNDIPFRKLSEKTNVGNISVRVDNGVRNPFIEVVRPIPYNNDSLFGTSIREYKKLSLYTDYIEVSDIVLNVSCTDVEKDELERILKQGIIIKSII